MFICEGLKIGLMFLSAPCVAEEFWEDVDPDEVSTFHSADQCWMGRGCYMSIASVTIYFSVMVYVVLAIMFHDYSHEEGEFVYDEISMPSFFHSIGLSTISSKMSGNSRGVIRSSSTGGSSGLTPRLGGSKVV